jgi:hypothetical protein
MHFPTVVSNQWVLMCVNPLFDTINFFDPTSTTSKEIQDELMNNLVFFKQTNITFGPLSHFMYCVLLCILVI